LHDHNFNTSRQQTSRRFLRHLLQYQSLYIPKRTIPKLSRQRMALLILRWKSFRQRYIILFW
jgi:hypothetical protein